MKWQVRTRIQRLDGQQCPVLRRTARHEELRATKTARCRTTRFDLCSLNLNMIESSTSILLPSEAVNPEGGGVNGFKAFPTRHIDLLRASDWLDHDRDGLVHVSVVLGERGTNLVDILEPHA